MRFSPVIIKCIFSTEALLCYLISVFVLIAGKIPLKHRGDSVYNDGKKYVPERQLRLCEREEKDG